MFIKRASLKEIFKVRKWKRELVCVFLVRQLRENNLLCLPKIAKATRGN